MIATKPLSGSIGAEVSGVDVSAVDETLGDELRQLLADRQVLVFREQHITPHEHARFAAAFGPLAVHPHLPEIDGAPGLIEVYDPTNAIATTWHQDQTFLASPPASTMLTARVLPTAGGDTLFSNQYRAYEALSESMRAFIDGLAAVHRRRFKDSVEEAIHPIAPVHPVTGRRALFVNRDYTVGIDGMSDEESKAILELLFVHSSRNEFTCRHHWAMGDVVVWDNLSVLHCVIGDVNEPRLLHKATMTR